MLTPPEGSSIDNTSSNNSTSRGMKSPATSPTESAAIGDTTAEQALDVTSPASHPLAQRLASGLPNRNRVTKNVAVSPAAAASVVLIATTTSFDGAAFSHSSPPAMF